MADSPDVMRVKVVRTPGELRDEIGHKIMVLKDWAGTVVERLDEAALVEAGFHPKRSDPVYLVKFDRWEQNVAVPGVNLVEIPVDYQVSSDDDYEDDDEDE